MYKDFVIVHSRYLKCLESTHLTFSGRATFFFPLGAREIKINNKQNLINYYFSSNYTKVSF